MYAVLSECGDPAAFRVSLCYIDQCNHLLHCLTSSFSQLSIHPSSGSQANHPLHQGRSGTLIATGRIRPGPPTTVLLCAEENWHFLTRPAATQLQAGPPDLAGRPGNLPIVPTATPPPEGEGPTLPSSGSQATHPPQPEGQPAEGSAPN
ncbi:unnamed protein product [Boreogadus saida]